MPRQSVWIALFSMLVATSAVRAAPPIVVPEGFEVELVAGPPLVQHPTMAGFDDQGRLYVCDGPGMNMPAKELLRDLPNLIRRLEDTDGDGRFDRSVMFADKMTFPMGALWYRGSVYTASPPHIWRLRDSDNDGVADERQVLVSEFGFTGNAADIHGCFLHPDGRLFWCDGRHGHNFVDEQGNQISKGLAARLFACRLDGKHVEAFAGGGMDNPVEVTFTEDGEPLGTVAIFDVLEGRHDALVHWIYGGAYPRYEQKCVDEFKRTGELLPSVSRWGQVAPSGVTRYRGSQFGKEFRSNVFSAHFNTHTIVRTALERAGATFRSKDEDFLVSSSQDFHPTDVIEDADGSLLVIDTGGWFRIGCPTSQIAKPEILGGIYRVRRKGAAKVDDPRGLKLAWNDASHEELAARLADARPAVIDRATSELHGRGDAAVGALGAVVRESKHVDQQRAALWTLARIDSENAREVIRAALNLRPQAVKQVAAQIVGTSRDRTAMERLCELLIEEGAAVRREAATALGRLNDQAAVPSLLAAASTSDDRFLDHSITYALIQLNDVAQTAKALTAVNANTRRMALVALDQMGEGALSRAQVAPLLDSTDVALQRAALDVISRRGWAAETLPLLAKWLTEAQPSTDRIATLERVLLAFVKDEPTQQLIGDALAKADTSTPVRLLLLDLMVKSGLAKLPPAWHDSLQSHLRSSDDRIARQAVASVAAVGANDFDTVLSEVARDDKRTAATRVAALNVLARHSAALRSDEFALLAARLVENVPPVDRLSAAEALGLATLSQKQQARVVELLATAGPLELPLLLRAFDRDTPFELGGKLFESLGRSPGLDNLTPERIAKLAANYPADVREIAQKLVHRLSANAQQQRARLDELSGQLEGGDAKRGRSVFNNSKYLCAACHRVQGQGALIGPDLTKIGQIRSRTDLLESIIFPSASFARGYESYSIATQSGLVHTGIMSRETADAIYLRNAQREEVRVSRDDVDDLAPSKISIMPQGLDKLLPVEDLRDLVAYLQSLK